jgi:hypothetical protein
MAAANTSWQNQGRFSSLLRGLQAYPYGMIAVLVFVGMSFSFVLRTETGEWDAVYVQAAQRLLTGEPIYRPKEPYVYPPVMAQAAIPFTYASQDWERLAWFLVSVSCLLFMTRWAWQLAGGSELPPLGRTGWKEHAIWLLGLACGFRYGLDCIAHQQTDVLVGALVLGGCVALVQARSLVGATCFGLAAGIKCTPLLWIVYLIGRRRRRAAAWVLAVAVGVNLLPDLVHRPVEGGFWICDWFTRHLLPMTRASSYPGQWYSEMIHNQSLAGAFNRWFLTTWGWANGGWQVVNRNGPVPPWLLKIVVYGTDLLLVLGAAFAVRGRRRDEINPSEPDRLPRAGLEFSLVLLLMVLLSPMSSKPHFCTLVLPGFCLARRAIAGRSWTAGAFLMLAIMAGILGTKGIWGGDVAFFALWCGHVTASALFLFLGCIHGLLSPPAAPIAAVPAPASTRSAAA